MRITMEKRMNGHFRFSGMTDVHREAAADPLNKMKQEASLYHSGMGGHFLFVFRFPHSEKDSSDWFLFPTIVFVMMMYHSSGGPLQIAWVKTIQKKSVSVIPELREMKTAFSKRDREAALLRNGSDFSTG